MAKLQVRYALMLSACLGMGGLVLLTSEVAFGQVNSPAVTKQNTEQNSELAEAERLNQQVDLLDQQGKYSEAIPLAERALAIRKKILNEHFDVATSLSNLAGLYSSQGRYSEAEPLFRQALEMRKRLLGDNHPDVATSLNNLAALYQSQGNITQAIEFLEKGMQVEEQNLNSNLSIGFERQKRDYINTVSGTTNWAISLNLNSAANNPEATNLALKTIFQRKGRILDVLTNNLQILRQRVDDKDSQKLIDELADAYSQLANLTYNQPEKIDGTIRLTYVVNVYFLK